jgi:sulfonate transport system substrate-binding protein
LVHGGRLWPAAVLATAAALTETGAKIKTPGRTAMLRRSVPIAALAAAAMMIAISAAGAEPVKIRAGWINVPASLIPILFANPGIARHEGVSYSFDPIYFSASGKQISAIATGELDIAPLGFSTVSIAILNAGLSDLRIVADETRDGVPTYNTVEYRVLRDGPVKTVADLKGKILATNGYGAGVDIGMRAYLARNNLIDKRDFTVIEAPFPTMRAILADRKADLVTATSPFKYDPDFEKIGRTLYTLRDALGVSELSFWCVRESFLQKNRAAFVDLLEDMIRSLRWYNDPANHKEAIDIVAKFTKQPAENLDHWAFTHKDYYRDKDALVDLDALQRNIQAQVELGFIKSNIDIAKYADLSAVKEAAARVR